MYSIPWNIKLLLAINSKIGFLKKSIIKKLKTKLIINSLIIQKKFNVKILDSSSCMLRDDLLILVLSTIISIIIFSFIPTKILIIEGININIIKKIIAPIPIKLLLIKFTLLSIFNNNINVYEQRPINIYNA